MGNHEISEMLGSISRQRVYQITRRADFPRPIARLAQGKVWLGDQVEAWIAERRGKRVERRTDSDPSTAGPRSGSDPTTAGSRPGPNPTTGDPRVGPDSAVGAPEAGPDPAITGPEVDPHPAAAACEAGPAPATADRRLGSDAVAAEHQHEPGSAADGEAG